MTRHWPDSQLDRITPPQVLDERGKAILRSLDHIIGERPIEEFHVRDALTCPLQALPALIAETSMEEFIEPGLPETIVRRILKHAWLLQSLAGKDAGVLLGLSLLGIDATITQWWQTRPKGRPHTHNIRIYVGEKLFDPDADVFLGDREVKAAIRMINACKRWSQDSTTHIGVWLQLNAHRTHAFAAGATYTHLEMVIGQRPSRMRLRAGQASRASGATIVTVGGRVKQRPFSPPVKNTQAGTVHAATIARPVIARRSDV